jgi:sec-independent protein translocase protein TatA
MYYLGVMGPGQIAIIVLVVVVLFFGGRKIPELMKGLGKGVKEFKDASKGEGDEKNDDAVSEDSTIEEKEEK